MCLSTRHVANKNCAILCSPNEDFGTMNKRWNADVRITFQWLVAQIKYSHSWKVYAPQTKIFEDFGRMNKRWHAYFRSTFQRFLAQIYAPQTKILEGGTKDEIRIFEALFNGSWPKLSTHALEKCFENPDFIFCSSFQNLRLGGVKLSTHVLEKCFENPHVIFCSSFQNLRLGGVKFFEHLHFILCSSLQNLRLGWVNFAPTT